MSDIIGFQVVQALYDKAGRPKGEKLWGRPYTARGAAETLADMLKKQSKDVYIREVRK